MTIDTTNMCSHLQRKLFEGIVSTTEIFPAGYLDLKPQDIKEIVIESL